MDLAVCNALQNQHLLLVTNKLQCDSGLQRLIIQSSLGQKSQSQD